MAHLNIPRFNDEQGNGKIPRWVHQRLSIEYFGIHATIHENGKVSISMIADDQPDKVQYDEVKIPAGLIFKLASLLKDTRKLTYISPAELKPDEDETIEAEPL